MCHFQSASAHCVWDWSRGGFVCLGRRVGFGPASVVSLVFLFWAMFGVGFGRLFPRLGGFVSLFYFGPAAALGLVAPRSVGFRFGLPRTVVSFVWVVVMVFGR